MDYDNFWKEYTGIWLYGYLFSFSIWNSNQGDELLYGSHSTGSRVRHTGEPHWTNLQNWGFVLFLFPSRLTTAVHTDAVPAPSQDACLCTGVKVNDRCAHWCGSSSHPRHLSVHRGKSERPPYTLMRLQPPSEALDCAPGSKYMTAVHADVVPAPSRALNWYAQHTSDNQTITNFRVCPREHPKERILLNIIVN